MIVETAKLSAYHCTLTHPCRLIQPPRNLSLAHQSQWEADAPCSIRTDLKEWLRYLSRCSPLTSRGSWNGQIPDLWVVRRFPSLSTASSVILISSLFHNESETTLCSGNLMMNQTTFSTRSRDEKCSTRTRKAKSTSVAADS